MVVDKLCAKTEITEQTESRDRDYNDDEKTFEMRGSTLQRAGEFTEPGAELEVLESLAVKYEHGEGGCDVFRLVNAGGAAELQFRKISLVG